MTKEELKEKHPEIYAAVFADGEKSGREKEACRVGEHVKMGEKIKSPETAMRMIREGKPMSAEVMQEYLDVGLKQANIKNRLADNVPDVTTNDPGDADEAALMKAFDDGSFGKTPKQPAAKGGNGLWA